MGISFFCPPSVVPDEAAAEIRDPGLSDPIRSVWMRRPVSAITPQVLVTCAPVGSPLRCHPPSSFSKKIFLNYFLKQTRAPRESIVVMGLGLCARCPKEKGESREESEEAAGARRDGTSSHQPGSKDLPPAWNTFLCCLLVASFAAA